MRFLHTADWHLGRPFHGESLLDAQAGAIERVAEVARSLRGVARSSCPATSTTVRCRRWRRSAWRTTRWVGLSELCPVVVISGQPRLRDAAGVRLGAPRARGGARAARTRPIGRPVAARRRLRWYAIPYLEPDVTRARSWGARSAGHGPVLGAAMAARPGGSRARARRARGRSSWRTRSSPARVGCASERDLAVGGVRRPRGIDVRGRGLRRARAPARAAADGRAGAVRGSTVPVLVLRGAATASPSPLVELGTARPAVEIELVPFPVDAAARDAARGRWTSCSPTPRTPITSGRGCTRRSPTPSGRATRWSPAAAVPARGRASSVRPARAAARGPEGAGTRERACAGSTTDRAGCARFVRDVRGSDAREAAELALLATLSRPAGSGELRRPRCACTASSWRRSSRSPAGRSSTSTTSARPACSSCTGARARARPRCWTPCASRSTARCPARASGGARLRVRPRGGGRARPRSSSRPRCAAGACG